MNTNSDNFENTLKPKCSCSSERETVMHFFLHFKLNNVIRANLTSDLIKTDEKLQDILPYGIRKFGAKNKQNILICTYKFIID